MNHEDEATHALSVLEVVLGIDLTGVELGDDLVLDVTADMLRRCREPVASEPATSVLVALIEGLRESYHRKPVHRLLVDMTKLVARTRLLGCLRLRLLSAGSLNDFGPPDPESVSQRVSEVSELDRSVVDEGDD
jgi:hypothetical protein